MPCSLKLSAALAIVALAPQPARAQEKAVVSLKDLVNAEMRHQGFTLPRPMKVHVYAKGAGLDPNRDWGETPRFFAYGWILNAATREVVWTMNYGNTKAEAPFRVADQYLDLPAGSYEAYFANDGFALDVPLVRFRGIMEIDRRKLGQPEPRPGLFRAIAGSFGFSSHRILREWRAHAGHYGMEIYALGQNAGEIQTFTAPLRWKNILATLAPPERGKQEIAFRCKKPVDLHVYAVGEGIRTGRMHDYGWILDARTRKRVWEMTSDKAQYAGGATKNRRTVETLHLPAGEYLAAFVADGSHSPSEWNDAPPCDPLLWGMTLAVPADAELSFVARYEPSESEEVVAELVKVGCSQDRKTSFELKAETSLRVHALGEADDDELADSGWIEDASGKIVWSMKDSSFQPAGGARKNRLVDDLVTLPKGRYTLRYRTDDSHAYGAWNAAAPTDAERYGITLYRRK